MNTLQRCLESLAVCHLQDEPCWPAARIVAQQDIDDYLRKAGPDPADRLQAMDALAEEFGRKFPDETDPVLIRSYIRSMMRRIRYEQQRPVRTEEIDPDAASAPVKVPEAESGDIPAEGDVPMTEQQRQDIARLCHEANVPDKSGEQLSAQTAQQMINELREKAAELLHK